METGYLMQEIKRLPLPQRFYVVEETIKSIKEEEQRKQMEVAADMLFNDYTNDEELTSFNSIDLDGFYEAK
ncbi:hypothetical protein ABIB40_002755 [Pedobacter sp. UYP30]|uniref:hypothetical protein n=1 Tax=Pedobacter sp. UYP30 TaxID=1756400 RepID=UPI0033965B8F